MKRRIISLLTALVLIFSCCFVSTGVFVSAEVVDYELSDPLKGATNKQLKFTGTTEDDTTDLPSGTAKKYVADATDAGIYINNVLTDLPITKDNNSNTWTIRAQSDFAADDVVTVKGTFTYKNSTTSETSSVRFNTITVKYNGSAWEITENPLETTEYDRTFELRYFDETTKYGTSGMIFLSGDDTLAGNDGSTFISFDDGEHNGVFLNGTKNADVKMKKITDQGWFVCLSDAGITAEKGDRITVKGAISNEGRTAIFKEAVFEFDGTTWADKTNIEDAKFTLCYYDNNVRNGTAAGIYLTGTDSLTATGWTPSTKLYFNSDDENGVFLNGEKINNVEMKKFIQNNWYVCLEDAEIQAGDIVTVKGALTQGEKTAIFEPIALVFDGTTWYLTDDPNCETGRSLSLDVQLGQPPENEGIYLLGDDTFYVSGWENATEFLPYPDANSGVFINDIKADVVLKKYGANKWYLSLSDGGLLAEENYVVTVKGTFTYEDYRISFNEDKFKFNGTTWETVENPDTTTLDFVDLLSISKFNTSTNKWEIYLSTTSPLPGADGTALDVSMKIGDSNQNITCKKSSQQHSFAFELDASLVPQNPQTEVRVVVRAGKYDVTGDSSKVKIENNIELYFYDGKVSLISSSIHVDEKNITFKLDRDMEGGGTVDGIFLTATDNVPVNGWESVTTNAYEGKTNGVFWNGIKTNAFLKKYETNKYYVCLGDVNIVPKEGDKVVIKGVFETNGYISSYNEYILIFKDGSWVDGTEPQTNYTTVNILTFEDSVSRFNAESNRWELYFTTKEKLPGNADQVFNYVVATINGKDNPIPCYHAGHKDMFFIIIPAEMLPKNATTTVTIGGKAKSGDHTIGMNVVPFTIYVNKYGISLDGYVSDDVIVETGRSLALDIQLGQPPENEGIFLTGDDSLPAPGWEAEILPDSESDSGVFVNGKKTNVVLKKYEGNKWYLSLADKEIIAKKNDVVTVKGTFTYKNYRITFNEDEFVFNGTTWETKTNSYTTTLDFVDLLPKSKFNTKTNKWEIYLSTTSELPGADGTTLDVLMNIGNTKQNITCKKSSQSFAFKLDASIVPQNPKTEVCVVVRGGKYDIKGSNQKVKIENNIELYFINGKVSLVSSSIHVDEKNITFKLDRDMEGGGNKHGIYLTAKDNVPYAADWSVLTTAYEGKTNGVFLNGVKTNVYLKKFDKDKYYVSLGDVNIVPKEGDKVVIKGVFETNGYISSYNEYILIFKDGSWVDGTEPQTNYTTVNILTFEDSVSRFNAESNRWELYFTTKEKLPGNADQVFNYVVATINGKDNPIPCYHAGHKDMFFIIIPAEMLPKNTTAKVTIGGKAKSGDHTIGMNVVPFTIYVNKYGISLDGYVSDDVIVEMGRSLALDIQLGQPPKNEGIYLTGDDSLPAPGWEAEILPDSESNSGVFVNGKKTNVVLKKYEGNKWYLSLADKEIIAKKNDVVTVKGTFTYKNYRITFNEDEFMFNGTTWETVENPYTTTLDFVDLLPKSKFNTKTNKWEIYLSTTSELPGADGTTLDVLMNIGNTKQNITCKKSSQSFAFKLDASIVPQNPKTEVCVVVRGGKYDIKGSNQKVKIENNIELYFINGKVSLVSSSINIDEKDITFKLDRNMEGGGTVKGIYLTANDNVPYDKDWETFTNAYEGRTNGVFLNGIKTKAFLKKFDFNKYYVCLGDVNIVPKEGDKVVIKGVFETNGYISSYNEYVVEFKDGSWVDGTEPQTNYTTVNILTFEDSVSRFNADSNRWELYFTTKEKLPGNADQVFNFVTTTINGENYKIPCYHAGYRDMFFIIIPAEMLPKNATATVTIGGKAKSEDHAIGMDVVPFTIYVNKYGISLEDYVSPIVVKQTDAILSLDTATFNWMAGTQTGVYLLTNDTFEVDKNWGTRIRAIGYDDESGVFYNGKKIDAVLKKYSEGHIYLDIAAGGVFAKNKDKITIKGTFSLNGYGVSYREINLYYNGQSWGTTYTAPLPKTTTKLNIIGIKAQSGYNKDRKDWVVYVKVDGEVPGERDHEFKKLVCEANGQVFDVNLYKADDCLMFFVPESIMPKDTKNGTTIKLKGGLISDNYELYDIDLSGELTLYTFYTSISQKPPTDKTKYLDITVPGLLRACKYVEDMKGWQLFFKVEEEFDVDNNTEYFNLPVKLDGKVYEEIRTYRSDDCLYVFVPESVLPKDTKTATITIDKGAKAVANSGWNGIRFKNKTEIYLFAGIWNNVKFDDFIEAELTFRHLNSSSYNSKVSRWDIYLNVDKEVPGENWFEQFEGLTAYLNGVEYSTYASKAESGNNRLLYISLDEAIFGEFKDGDVIRFPKGVVYSCGGYRIKNAEDFYLQYLNGTWFEYYETKVKAPESIGSIWETGRIDDYIPVQEEKGIMFTSVEPTNVIKLKEDYKDVTFTFDTTKMLAFNEDLPTNSIILRGRPLADGMDISETALYGYNISFSYIELTEERFPNNPELWGIHSQEIAVWKNGINYPLMDQYRMTYNWKKTDHPFFEYDKKYEYKISIYNVEEDICFIEIYCNDELIMRVVDRGTDDELDPVYNGGQIYLYASCPQYLYSPTVELDTLEASKNECYIGDQVRVSATYPAVLEGSEYKVEGDGEGATIKDGVFVAKVPGIYTVTGTYNGVSKGSVQIKVLEKPNKVTNTEESSSFPIIPVAVGGGVAVVSSAAAVLFVFLKKKKV